MERRRRRFAIDISTFRHFDKLNAAQAQTLDELRCRATLRSGKDFQGLVPT